MVPAPGDGEAPRPWLVDRLFRNLLVDVTGNTHRAEICIDKLFSPDGPTGRLGLVEFRSFEMPPDARMSLAQQLAAARAGRLVLARAAARRAGALGHGAARPLHARAFRLGGFSRRARRSARRRLSASIRSGSRRSANSASRSTARSSTAACELELRQALEPWHVLGEEGAAGGTARFVDSSVERLQVKVEGLQRRAPCRRLQRPARAADARPAAPASMSRASASRPGSCHRRCSRPSTCMRRSPSTSSTAGAAARSAAASITSRIPAAATTRPSRSIPTRREARRLARFEDHGHTPGIFNIPAEERSLEYPDDPRPAAPDSGLMAAMASNSTAPRRTIDDLAPLLAGYRPLPGIFDEMMDRDGRVRAHWRPFLAMLAALGPGGDQPAVCRGRPAPARFRRVLSGLRGPGGRRAALAAEPCAAADRRRRNGRRSRPGSSSAPSCSRRSWPTSMGRPTWCARAGCRPPSLPATRNSCGRWSASRRPAARICASTRVDVGRSPDGRWWVLGDRTQAPSGAGYALENRLALSRAMPDIYRALRVERARAVLPGVPGRASALNRQDDSRVCVLTPGPLNETYFEHAYLARYLGFLLVEGEDLTVRDDGVFIRTVSGLKRAEVLLRRLDSDFADPLELSARSRLGVPGLVQAVRDGTVVIANALGSGVVEARALLSFLPALAPAVLGERARAAERRDLVARRAARARRGPRAARRPGDRVGLRRRPAAAHRPARSSSAATLDAGATRAHHRSDRPRGVDFVAQEAVTLSTTPVWRNGAARAASVHPAAVRWRACGDGWRVMPGGFVRVADDVDARAVNLQRGGRTADAWVLSDKPVAETTLLPTPDRIAINRATGALPSRAAANLFWLGALRRARRGDAAAGARAGQPRDRERRRPSADVNARIVRAARRLGARCRTTSRTSSRRWSPPRRCSSAISTGALPHLAGAAQSAASVIRDRFSPDAWRALTDLVELINAPFEQGPTESAMFERINGALRIIASFSGLAQENMSQLAGWRFLETRAPHRARARDLRASCASSRSARARRRARRAAGACRQPDHLSAALRHGGGARAGDRSRGARSEQSALGRLSARPHRDASRGAAQARRRRPPVAARADRDRARDQDAHGRCRGDRRSRVASRPKRR